MRNYQELVVWQKSHTLTLKIYHVTKSFPLHETHGLTSQVRRSASSIPSNISEGCGRESNTELKRFFVIASGSASELDYQLLLARDLEYLPLQDFEDLYLLLTEIRKMLHSFINKLNQ